LMVAINRWNCKGRCIRQAPDALDSRRALPYIRCVNVTQRHIVSPRGTFHLHLSEYGWLPDLPDHRYFETHAGRMPPDDFRTIRCGGRTSCLDSEVP
jgi:hypothetical protein